jgi:hypothetical protein
MKLFRVLSGAQPFGDFLVGKIFHQQVLNVYGPISENAKDG